LALCSILADQGEVDDGAHEQAGLVNGRWLFYQPLDPTTAQEDGAGNGRNLQKVAAGEGGRRLFRGHGWPPAGVAVAAGVPFWLLPCPWPLPEPLCSSGAVVAGGVPCSRLFWYSTAWAVTVR